MPVSPTAIADQLKGGPASAAELTHALAISQPALSRATQALQREGHLLKIGATRGARYALRRVVPGTGSEWPVFRIDGGGAIHELGHLHALARSHYYFDGKATHLAGLTEGLPYFLHDARPAGFLGRSVPAAYPELSLPSRVVDWTVDYFLAYLTRRGAETVGDLVVGGEALDYYLSSLANRRAVAVADRAQEYPSLARAAMQGAPTDAPVHGQQPKFTVLVADGKMRRHMIVKFSPPRASRAGQRWSDLLIAEHLAHRVLDDNGFPACRSSVFEFSDRTFLEVERFDRVGEEGRCGVVSLLALDSTRYARLDSWTLAAERLAADGLLSAEDLERTRLIATFGMLIANSDRHFGNLSLIDRYEGRFELAPVYDMLPMLFAPQHEQILERSFEPAQPSAATLTVWPHARALAQDYWGRLAEHSGVSAEFRAISAAAFRALKALRQRAAE